ncbi:hypothetical protein, conserved [Eimeria necatrix]|uniref:Uncharacterized protein n=1 Tax=Eimeria necatrix TaxID=51315 RepID=U6N000_9EIME|nr:hypothetical protein, conserved [Eimeria necatrix]CDJ68064.1 hypothetical protein, conserved [Eimeria necatrix]
MLLFWTASPALIYYSVVNQKKEDYARRYSGVIRDLERRVQQQQQQQQQQPQLATQQQQQLTQQQQQQPQQL